MRRFFGGLIYLSAGILAGAASAFVAIENAGVETSDTGSPWLSRAAALSSGSSLYVRSHYLIDGRLPPAPGQIMEVSAETDDDGQPLTSSCRYSLNATGPLPQWWSLAVTGNGSDPASRQATADADSIIRGPEGNVIVTASVQPQPGNWLKVPEARRFVLVYSAIPGNAAPAGRAPFNIKREGC